MLADILVLAGRDSDTAGAGVLLALSLVTGTVAAWANFLHLALSYVKNNYQSN